MRYIQHKFLDTPTTEEQIRDILRTKQSIKHLYYEIYQEYKNCIQRGVPDGLIIECGAGVGFAKEIIPNLTTSDILDYSNVDMIMDATNLPFPDISVSIILMNNVFHHIPDVARFLAEAQRCLKQGGRIMIADQYPGLFAKYIYKYFHFEPFDEGVTEWKYASQNPLLDANGALAWIVFVRDYKKFQERFPQLQLEHFTPHTPLRYWLSGGLKKWSLLPAKLFQFATWVDRSLIKLSPKLGSFVFIEIVKAG